MVRMVILLGLVALSGCAQSGWKRSESLVSESSFKVELEQLSFEGQPKSVFGHPVDVSSAVVSNAFSALQYKPRSLFGDPVPEPAVVPNFLPALAQAVSSALARAKDSERVRFEMRERAKSLYVLPSVATTRGVAFVSTAGELNLVFDEVHALPEIDESGTRGGWGNPTRRARSSGRLALPEYATAGVNERGSTMPLWAVLPLDRIPTEAPTAEVATNTESAAVGNATTPTAKTETSTGATEEKPLSDAEIVARLRYLEELYQDGSLTEDQYKEKRAALLGTTPKR